MTRSVSIFFIAQGDHLTAQAILLGASLRFHNGAAPQLIAYVPDRPETEPVPDAARAAFDLLGVDLRPLAIDPRLWKSDYPHGNKLLACAAPRDADVHMFLDSDIACVAPLDFDAVAPHAVTLVPEGTPTWGKTGDRWERLYAHFGLALPTEKVRLVRRRRIEFLPYFNAGMIAFPRTLTANGRSFPDLWIDTAREIDWNADLPNKRPWLDQIALPVTLKRFGLAYHTLHDAWNFSISDRAFEADAEPKLIHYHSFRFAPNWPQVRAELARMQDALGADLMARLTPLYGQHWFRESEPAL